ncbi:hypothetical protein HSBAA_24190 [Vreelandella sulfidaeris]|uniref:ABC transporter domain-containing protein n=1 Tax=Vreelandella sulfidaeris TaxID=115553 RepID=A0A455U7E3_9GAMM|nr:hypothetical protein HSBAA_24190 [Halomonas sulfidaeris]
MVKDINIEISQGSVVGLLGPNGAGKTTSFYMIVGLVKSDAGEVGIDDVDLTRAPMHERAAAGIGYLPKRHLFSVNYRLPIILWRYSKPAKSLTAAIGNSA